MGALDTVLDSNARVTPFRILLQVPGSQSSWVIASGESRIPILRTSSTSPVILVSPSLLCLPSLCQELPWRR